MKRTAIFYLLTLILLSSVPTLAHDGLLPPQFIEGDAPAVQLEVTPDPVSGWNARIITEGFTFAPEHAGAAPQDGEGHAYLFVNGLRAARVYGEWFHIGELPPGAHEVAVTLNANNSANLAADNALIMAKADVIVPVEELAPNTAANDRAGHIHTFDLQTGGGSFDASNTLELTEAIPAVDVEIKRDGLRGWNVRVLTENFAFAPENAGSDHVPGQGHAHLYVDGVKITRLVDDWYHLDGYDAPGHTITVALTSNDHRLLAADGAPITASVTTAAYSAPQSFKMGLVGTLNLAELVPPNAPTARYQPESDTTRRYTARDGKAVNRNGASALEGSDIWGWTDPMTNEEVAIVALTTGTSFVSLADPANPRLLGYLPTETTANLWRDVKVYNNHAFIVADIVGAHGMQVFDLTRLRGITEAQVFAADTVYTGVGSVHNIAINEATGYAYLVGDIGDQNMGLHILDISTPTSPVFVTEWVNRYAHDTQVVIYNGPDADYQGREIAINADEDRITIVDVTNKQNISIIAEAFYAGVAYTHQGWLTEDHRYFLANDEGDERGFGQNTRTYLWDFSDLDNPQLIDYYQHGTASVDHNLYTHNGQAFMANYSSGLRVFDLDDIANGNLSLAAYYDTYPANDGNAFVGAWSAYPYFASGNIIIGDINNGLFVVRQSDVAPEPTELVVIDADTAIPVTPTFTFKHQTDISQTQAPADAYRLYLRRDPSTKVIDVTLPVEQACTGVECSISAVNAPEFAGWGLVNGNYTWWVGAITGGNTVWSPVPGTFSVVLDPPADINAQSITVTPNQGRPTIAWENTSNAPYYQLYVGNGDRVYQKWYTYLDACFGSNCALDVTLNFPAGAYAVWVRPWGAGGMGNWIQGPDLTLAATIPLLPTVINVVDAGAAQPTVQWTSGHSTTWFQLAITDASNSVIYNTWHEAHTIGCADPIMTCSVGPLDLGTLTDGVTYGLYVRPWGPGGFGSGGPLPNNPQWAADDFTYTPGG